MIPRTVHFIWLGSRLPDHLRVLVDTFRAHHPRWRTRWWHDKHIDEFGLVNQDLYDRAADYVPADSVYQLRSDIARYEILYRDGGLYVDCDYRWQAPIDPHLRGHSLVCGWELQYRWVANGIIAARRRHPALLEAIRAIPARAAAHDTELRANRLTGPHLWTPIAKRHAHIAHQRVFCPAPWSRPYDADEPHPYSTAVHLWNHQRELRAAP